MRKKLILILLIALSVNLVYSQEQRRFPMGNMQMTGSITGKLIDEQSGKPIEYGNVVLYRFRDSSMVTGTISNAQGNFVLDKVNVGRYFIKISFIGFETKVIDSVLVTPRNSEVDLGTIKLVPAVLKLGDVVVQSEKELIINNLDKKVINVEKDLTNVGGSALDVMQNLPSVTVDADGNVALRGSTNIRLLIDGKPTNMEGVSNYDVLSQIPASQIEQVELITNPSVRYDPEGTAGIINIVLKKRREAGVNGIATLNAGTGDKYNTSFNFNYKLDGWNVYAGYDGRINKFKSSGSNDRISSSSSLSPFLNQTQSGFNKMNSHNFTFGVDYNLDDFNSFSTSLKVRRNSFDNVSSNLDYTYNAGNVLESKMVRSNSGDRSFNNLNFSFGYKRTFEQRGRELTADFLYSNFNMNRTEDADQMNYIYLPTSSQTHSLRRLYGEGKNNMYILQANYIHPFEAGFRIETGFQSTIRTVNSFSDYFNYDFANQVFTENLSLKNYFEFDEQVHAVYGIFSHRLFGIKYQVGLRTEQAFTKSRLPLTNQSFKKDYTSLYPSVHISYEFLPMNEIQLSYSRRVDRPNNRQLNPVVDYSDSLNVFAGNPYLNPQYTNSYELNLNNALGFVFLNTSLFYRTTNGIITTVTKLLPNGVLYNTFDNIAKSENYGVEFIWTQPIASWWRLVANFSYFRTKLDGQGLVNVNQDATSWMTRIMSSFTFWDKTQLQVIFNYNSPTITMGGGFGGFGGGFGGGGGRYGNMIVAQGKMNEMYGLDLAVRKDFFNDKLSVTLRLSDVFNTRKFGGEVTGQGFTAKFNRKMDTRILFIGLTYKFNNYQSKRERLNPDETEQEMF
ncbi:MAG: TonB-dependent receptor [Ignavibacterium sp.]|nr:TonB-dependent receptor [Ignavibacterium sp.]